MDLQSVFSRLKFELPEINGIAVVSSDGQTLKAEWPANAIDQDKIGAVGAAVLGLGRKSIQILTSGQFLHVTLHSTESVLSVYSAGPKGVLIVSMNKTGNLGLLTLTCREAARDIDRYLESINA